MELKGKYKAAFAGNLSRLMKQKGFTRKALAEAVDLSYPTIAAYLSGDAEGKGVLPSVEKAVQIADYLGVSLDELFGRTAFTPSREGGAPLSKDSLTLSDILQQLKNIYFAAETLDFSVNIDDSTNSVSLRNDNRFVKLFFDRVKSGEDIDDTLEVFKGLTVYNGELVDPITFKILERRDK